MRRKVLIAESVDTMRSVAETVLRQNGYDVIAVSAADKVREVLKYSRPDLIVLGADLPASDQTPCYEKIRRDPKTSDIPMLLFEPADKADLGFPDEVVVPRPFDPSDLLAKVNVFLGQTERGAQAEGDPLGGSSVDDDFLDAALGLDQIDVTDSEDMDKSFIKKAPKGDRQREQMVGLDVNLGPERSLSESSKIESLIINEDTGRIRQKPPKKPPPAPTGTGKLEILSDQYGLSDPGALSSDGEVGAHDYDWFVNAIRKDNASAQTKPYESSDSGKLTIADPSAAVDPVTLGPGQVAPGTARAAQKNTAGVEQFIDEFKREIEQLRSDESDELVAPSAEKGTDVSAEEMMWEEKLEDITPQHVRIFAREFAQELGRKVAEMIVAKIDSDKLLRLIKDEIVRRQRKKS